MMRLSQAAQALGVPLAGGDVEFTAVCTDSRTVRRGDLFVALRGERFDGHEFVAQAAAGASAAMVESAAAAIAAQLPLLVKGSRSMQMERVVTAFAVPREERGERGEGRGDKTMTPRALTASRLSLLASRATGGCTCC